MVLWLGLAKCTPTKLNLGLRNLPLLYHYITVQADIYGIAAIPAENPPNRVPATPARMLLAVNFAIFGADRSFGLRRSCSNKNPFRSR